MTKTDAAVQTLSGISPDVVLEIVIGPVRIADPIFSFVETSFTTKYSFTENGANEPSVVAKLQNEVDSVLGDCFPTIEYMKKLKYTTRVINESLRLYP
ncbi:Cytochrome p450 [Thalictrum thalictroides]|uniref:Cytochrome p450 n=1 Tax=Thalictrum thalictroides TaxID=46969 RepID=A0A7J6W4N6_THATH|nr:Cytochrome p450 [Thalictrum thalictroides]